MSRYRKVEVKIWGDEKFNRLSKLPCSGQSFFLICIIGPHTTNIPGLFSIEKEAICGRFKWATKAFQEAFQEVFQEGMVKAIWEAPITWLPNGLLYNKPESPNVVVGWRDQWDLLPECNIKREAYEVLKAGVHAYGKGYPKAFDENIRKPSGKPFFMPFDKPSLKAIGIQEQEQEQEQDIPPKPPLGGDCEIKKSFDRIVAVYPKGFVKSPKNNFTLFRRKKLHRFENEIIAAIENFKAHDVGWIDGFIPLLSTFLNGERWNGQIRTERAKASNQRVEQRSLDEILGERGLLEPTEVCAAVDSNGTDGV